MKKYPSLHTITEYSFLESTIKIDSLISYALENKLEALAITDHNNMFGVAEFIDKTSKNGIKPIIGVDLDVDSFRVILLAKNYDGFKELTSIVSEKSKGVLINEKMIDSNNLIVIDHPKYGFVKNNIKLNHIKDYYVTSSETLANSVQVSFTRMLLPNQAPALGTLDKLSERIETNIDDQYYRVYSEGSSASIDQINEIINSIDIVFPDKKNPIPKFMVNKDSNKLLKAIINENSKNALGENVNNTIYIERLKYEVSIIEKLGFSDYFLIIWDLLEYARSEKILIGPGRGSAAGSLVSFVLKITEIDPIKYDLLFERFLNPERVSMPDIDIDIQDNKREKMVDYLFNKYGKESTALISTFQRLGAKSSIRDIGRLNGFANADVLALTKLIPNFSTLDEAFNTSTRFRAAIQKSDSYTNLFEMAKEIEGLPRQLGTHAAGVVISNDVISTFAPVTKSSEGRNQTQYSMEHLEKNGLLKIDLLGLRNLTIIVDIQKEIFRNFNKRVVLSKIPTSDIKTNKLLSNGDSNGIFQLESYGMKKTLIQVGVSSVDDLAAIISLYRPGPMEYIGLYANIKNGISKIKKIGKAYDEIVKPTYGIIVYQEQIMQIAQKYAGMSFGRADIFRRAIGKKKIDILKKLNSEFIEGSIASGHSKDEAVNIFDIIIKFANYGFNKSHAYAYAILAYRMAYLKAWFPFEFFTALISASSNSLKTLKQYIFESKKMGINIVAPDINRSKIVVYNQKPSIILPLSIIKGVGDVANKKIISERENHGSFADFFEFVARLRNVSISEAIIISLIKASSLRDFGDTETLLNSLPQAMRYADMITSKDTKGNKIDFSTLPKPQLIITSGNVNLDEKYENEIFGFNISIFKSQKFEFKNKIANISNGEEATIVAEIKQVKKIRDKNGNEMGIIKLQDSTMSIEVFVFHHVFSFIKNDKKGLLVKAKLLNKNGSFSLRGRWEVINE